ncbi:MAG: outer membrane beta-barrel protein, partial [Myxococcota bacterium]
PPPPTQTVIVVEQQPAVTTTTYTLRPRRALPHNRHGLSLRLAGVATGENGSLGGMLAAYRFRPVPHFALEFGAGVFGGEDEQGSSRIETPLTVDALVFLNARGRWQPYVLAGIGFSRARVDREGDLIDGFGDEIEYAYVGGQVGLGIEWRLTPHFALNADVRGFVRTRIDDEPEPEFVRVTETGIETTDTSGGALFTFGMNVSW